MAEYFAENELDGSGDDLFNDVEESIASSSEETNSMDLVNSFAA